MLSYDNKNVVKQRVELAADDPKEKIQNKNKRKKPLEELFSVFFLLSLPSCFCLWADFWAHL